MKLHEKIISHSFLIAMFDGFWLHSPRVATQFLFQKYQQGKWAIADRHQGDCSDTRRLYVVRDSQQAKSLRRAQHQSV